MQSNSLTTHLIQQLKSLSGDNRICPCFALVIPIAGWLVNQFNGKYVFIGASILFGITSVLAGISWNAESFIVFRIIQGMSAGIITTLMFTLLIKTTGQDNIGKVMAVVSTPMIFGPILGPVIGGFIIHIVSWRGCSLLMS